MKKQWGEMDDQKLYSDEILEEFKRVYGEKKYNKINYDIENSNKSKQLINECLSKSIYPPGDEIVACEVVADLDEFLDVIGGRDNN